jgi:hypothetical protein
MPDFFDLPWWLRTAIGFAAAGPIIIVAALHRVERQLNAIYNLMLKKLHPDIQFDRED